MDVQGSTRKGTGELKRWRVKRRHLEGWGPAPGGGRVRLEWLRPRSMVSGQFGLLEKSASWAEVGRVGASWLLSDESAKVETVNIAGGLGAQVRGSFGG